MSHVSSLPTLLFLLSHSEFVFTQPHFLTSLRVQLLAKITLDEFMDDFTSGVALAKFMAHIFDSFVILLLYIYMASSLMPLYDMLAKAKCGQ